MPAGQRMSGVERLMQVAQKSYARLGTTGRPVERAEARWMQP